MGCLTRQKSLESSSVHSIAGVNSLISYPPFRSPHHSASLNSIVGGGANCLPGEISLAHNGVLFLDEFAEFPKNIIDALRQPIETGEILISRVKYHVSYPARFLLVAAMNPCKCGYFSSSFRSCTCSKKDVVQYLSKISGPIKQRIPIAINMDIQVDYLDSVQKEDNWILESQKLISNAMSMGEKHTADILLKEIDPQILKEIKKFSSQYKLSTREIYSTIELAQTIAHTELSNKIKLEHLYEACSYTGFFFSNILI
jgi:magnesium chelatase family protein